MNKNQIIRIVFSVALALFGVVMTLIDAEGEKTKAFLDNVGLALIVAGVFATFREGVLARFKADDSTDFSKLIANEVYNKLLETPLDGTGIQLVAKTRKEYRGYCSWTIPGKSQELFFAGRSVLHRIDADFRSRKIGKAEQVIAKCLLEGSQVRIMFIDPRSDLVARLAKQEKRHPTELLSDIAYTVGVCERLHECLKSKTLPIRAKLEIRVSNEIPYFAYHKVDNRMIVGFYFSSTVRNDQSPAFEVVNEETKRYFEEHILSNFERAEDGIVLDVNEHRKRVHLNNDLIRKLRTFLEQNLEAETAGKLLRGE